ncbi:MAG TPA: metalloregulator ArsR/SmtB family transcription factor [Candidatus Norongarragalinales archaeon]|nr:metalloregulator ArsR/SmtB family transcription factor [Candidatus Norongarragalinales archaeon]
MNKGIYALHADLCKTFSNPTRLEILDLLRDGPLSVSELVKKTGVGQANLSQHLGVMKSKGVLRSSRKGLNVYYELCNPKVLDAFDLIRSILRDRLKENRKIMEAAA